MALRARRRKVLYRAMPCYLATARCEYCLPRGTTSLLPHPRDDAAQYEGDREDSDRASRSQGRE